MRRGIKWDFHCYQKESVQTFMLKKRKHRFSTQRYLCRATHVLMRYILSRAISCIPTLVRPQTGLTEYPFSMRFRNFMGIISEYVDVMVIAETNFGDTFPKNKTITWGQSTYYLFDGLI